MAPTAPPPPERLYVAGASEIALDGFMRLVDDLGGGHEAVEHLTDAAFAIRYLRHSALFPDLAPWFEPAPVHRELSELADRYARLILEISRDFAKTTWCTIRLMRLICENRNLRVLLISKTQEAAMRIAAPIREQLEGNEAIIRDYGPFQGRKKWTNEEFRVIRTATFKESTVQCVGRQGQVVSGRYDIVVSDDVEDLGSTRNPERLAGTQAWFDRDVLPTVAPGGQVLIIETPQAEGDLPATLAKKPLWVSVSRPSEAETERAEDPAAPWLRRRSNWGAKWMIYWDLDCAVARVERAGGPGFETRMARAAVGLEPDKFPGVVCKECPAFRPGPASGGRGCLTGKRVADVGPVAYRLQYLVDRGALGGDIFLEEWFQTYEPQSKAGVHWTDGRWWFRHLPLTIGFGIDPAVADEGEVNPEQYSKFGLVVLGVHRPTRLHCLLSYINARVVWPDQLKMLTGEIVNWWPEVIGIEASLYDKVLKSEIQGAIAELRGKTPGLPEVRVRRIPAVLDKTAKFTSLTPEVAQGLLWVGPGHQAFVKQATLFPRGTHNDLLDAYYYAKKATLGIAPMFAGQGAPVQTDDERAAAAGLVVPQVGAPKPGEWTRDQVLGSVG